MRRHREIAEQALAFGHGGIFGDDHVAKAPHGDVAEIGWRREQPPVTQLLAEYRVGDVVGGESKAIDFHQQRVIGQRARIGQVRLDQFALLEIISGDDEVG